MSTEMSNKLSVREGLIKVENAQRFQSKPEAAGHAHVVVMQKTGKSLRHYTTLRTSNEHLSIGEKFWGDYVCYIVDMSARRTKIGDDFVTRDHLTKVKVNADISYKATDGERVALGVDDALLTLKEELTTFMKREISRLAIDQVTEDFLEGRIYQEGMRLQNWTGLAMIKVAVALQWPNDVLDEIKARRERRRQESQEDKNMLRGQRLEKAQITHIDEIMAMLGISSMPADMKLKLKAMPRAEAELAIADFIAKTRDEYRDRKTERDEREYTLLLSLMNNGTLEKMDLVGLGEQLIARHMNYRKGDQESMNIRGMDEDMDISPSVLFGQSNKKSSGKRLGGSSSEQKRISRPVDDTEPD